VRTVTVSGFAELELKFFLKRSCLPRLAIALDELSSAYKRVGFSGVVTDAYNHIQVERAYRYRAGRL
jgi:hypothetical protein